MNDKRLALARELIVQAPPGQLDVILNDIQVISDASGNEPLSPPQIAQLRADHTREHHGVSSCDSSSANQPALVNALSDALQEHKKKFYSSKGVEMSFSVNENGDTSVLVRSIAERVDTGNCHAGSWMSTWTVRDGSISGDVLLRAFCHENGITQLHTSRSFGPTMVTSANNDDDKDKVLLARDLVAQISAWETNLLETLGQMHDDMGNHLKSLRRVLPVTRKKLDWSVHAHRMAKTLNDTAK